MRIIINADDFGMSPRVNNAILDLLVREKISSSTILANAPFAEQACAQIHRFPKCSFGVHLNVTEFRPIRANPDLYPLLNSRGEFIMNRVREIHIDKRLSNGIFNEFCAQVEKVQNLGVNVSHLDSHNYVASIPRLLPILKRVQKLFGIRKVRITRNIYSPEERIGLIPRMKKYCYNFVLRNYYPTKTTDGFSGFDLFHRIGSTRRLAHGTFEVVVHPGNDYYDAKEVEILEGSWSDPLKFQVRLVSYHDL